MRYVITILIIISISSCTFQRLANNKLLAINNLENFFCQDYSNNLNYLMTHELPNQKEVKSISIYQYSSGDQKYLLEDSIILNKRGKPVVNFKGHEFNQFSRTYFFYDNNGNGYLDITIGSNNYDTTYVLRKFDKLNRISKELSYNATRKEYGRIFITDITLISDSVLNIRYEFYEPDLKHENILPFETRDIKVKILNDSIVQTKTNRIVQYDTKNKSSYIDLYKIENNTLVPISKKSLINTKIDSDCFETRNNQCHIKRVFEFYTAEDNETNNEFSINQSIVQTLTIKIDSLPIEAWAQYRKNLDTFSDRNKILESGINIDSIELNESLAMESFTPQLWRIVSQDSGHISGIENLCYVVGYNTPLKKEDDFNKRCLVIYESKNGKFIVRKQSFGALEDFNDSDKDLLFDGNDETNFTVNIEDGNIVVNYSYMRGESTYVFSHMDGKWILEYYESNHRTCCQAESYSYNYLTKKYSYSTSSMGEDTKGDTAVTVFQERSIMYMDSINIREFDYNETGLIVK